MATIVGPKDTVFDNLSFKMTITFSTQYPFKAPQVKFLNHCFHPNISPTGDICLDILKVRSYCSAEKNAPPYFFLIRFSIFEPQDSWSALYDVRTILLSIQSLLGEPNLDSPLDSQAAKMWGRPDYRKYVLEKVKMQIK